MSPPAQRRRLDPQQHRRDTHATDDAARVDEIVRSLEQAARQLGFAVTIDGHVSEAGAAVLLDRQPTTLRHWRAGARPLAYRRLGGARGRITYSLRTIATYKMNCEWQEAAESASTSGRRPVIVRSSQR
jgi:hypothetical protein